MIKRAIVGIGSRIRKILPAKMPDFSMVRKICIFKTGAIGDVLMTTPLLRALRKRFSRARIDYWVGEWSAPVLENNPHIDRVISFNERPFYKKNLIAINNIARKIRNEKYDLMIILDFSYLANMFGTLCKVPIRIGFDRNGEGFPNTLNAPYGKRMHDVDSYLEIARVVGSKSICQKEIELFLTNDEERFARMFFRKHKLNPARTIAIAPGGAKNPGMTLNIKRWPAERFAKLAERLSKRGFQILLVGGPDDIDAAEIVKERVPNAVDATGKTSLRKTAALIKRCRRLVCNDSGLMHIASAVNTPVTAIFGPTDPIKLAPRGPKDKYLWKHPNKKPCYIDGMLIKCPDNHECIKRISVNDALRAVE
ncbi:MAG: lipopolysaccharide heptosyltransferase II [Candidatus Woesearchaeota archaeon]